MAPTPVDGSGAAGPRIVVASTSEDLKSYRSAASEVARELGFEPLMLERPKAGAVSSVEQINHQIAAADLLLAVVGWRRGAVPTPDQGGDGRRSWTAWEIASALGRAQPLVVLMASDKWPDSLREEDPETRAWMLDFRGDLHSLAAFFEPEPEKSAASLAGFRELAQQELARHRTDRMPESPPTVADSGSLQPRQWPPPELPERPYPLLLHYTHPELLAGRERELAEVDELLRLPVPILGLYAPSGAGKSSLLAAGLVPRLNAAGMAVSFDRHPSEPGLAGRLIGDLLDAEDPNILNLGEEDYRGFVDRLLAARALTDKPPLLILDQLEDLLHQPASAPARLRRARALTGMLLAASLQRQPACDGPLCHWLLAYRQEFHGEVFLWLSDVLREARSLGLVKAGTLPHDLSGPERFHAWSLQPLGMPRPGSDTPTAEAARAFQAAIEKPLMAHAEEGRRYRWRFAPGDAQRLAQAFGEARRAQPRAPLVPELQVVLAHLLEHALPSPDGKGTIVEVPEEPGELITDALEQHVLRALDAAFPTPRGLEPDEAARLGRTRALLMLRELADASGQRADGLTAQELARAIGRDGREVLEELATPQTRLVVAEEQGGEWTYVLSHECLAEVLVRLVDGQGDRAGLEVDTELLGLRRFVALKSELFASGEAARATEVPVASRRRIERHAPALLWSEAQRRWWQACQKRFRTERRQTAMHRAIAVLGVLATLAAVWLGTRSRQTQTLTEALKERVAQDDRRTAFQAVHQLLSERRAEPEEILEALALRPHPLDILEHGISGSGPQKVDGRAVQWVAELATALIERDPETQVDRISSLVWSLDSFAPKDEKTQAIRNRALAPLRSHFDHLAAVDDFLWAEIPGGTFWMGSDPQPGPDSQSSSDEQPRHQVTLSPFRMSAHEVTNGQFRRLFPEHDPKMRDHLPAVNVTWYQAYTYAAWLGGRLPTEAEAEYVRRAGCDSEPCLRGAREALLREQAWWSETSLDFETQKMSLRRVGQRRPNPWGLFDLYGNARELCADWYGSYPDQHLTNPAGPTHSRNHQRVVRGGHFFSPARDLTAPRREAIFDNKLDDHTGFRIVLPGATPD